MDASNKTQAMTADQMATLLDEIANEALSLRDLCTDISCSPSDFRPQAFAVIATVAEKIGAIADLGIEKLKGRPNVVGSMQDWMLSPAARAAINTEGE